MINDPLYVTDPLIVEVFLYKNNYKDRLLIAELKEGAQLVLDHEEFSNSFYVRSNEVYDILHDKFRRDLLNFSATAPDELSASINSVYFLVNILESFKNMKYLKINISDAEVYSRRVNDMINFDYRIIHSRVDLGSILMADDLKDVKSLFIDVGIYQNEPFKTKPYLEIATTDLLNILSSYGSRFDPIDKVNQLINGIKSLLGSKVEKDNSILLIIIDK
jgi:hypothetical protein